MDKAVIRNINKKNLINSITYFCISIPIFIHIKTVYEKALNIPREDDYDAVLAFFCKYKNASIYEKISLLFSQQCEHRGVFSKIIYLAHYFIYGTINFRHYILFDILLLIAILFLLVYFIRKCFHENWRVPALTLSLGLFDLNNYENADFDSAGLFNYGIIFLFLLCILFYNFRKSKFVVVALILQFILIFSGGNGMIGAFFIVLFNVFRKDKIGIITSSLVLILFSPLYFYHFTNPNSIYVTLNVTLFLPYFLTALGSNFGIDLTSELILGILLLAILIFFFPLKKLKNNPDLISIVCIAGFIIISLGAMSVFRGKLPLQNASSSRYLIYTHILMALGYLFLFSKYKTYFVQIVGVIFFSFVFIHNYRFGKSGFDSFYNCMKNTDYCYPPDGKEHAKQTAAKSCELNIYCLDKHRKN